MGRQAVVPLPALPLTVITVRNKTLLRQQPIKAQLPLRCPWGTEIREMPVGCGSCKKPIDPDWVRGVVKQPISCMVEIEAIAVCHPCRRIAEASLRFYEDGRVLVGSGGGWAPAVETTAWWRKALNKARTLLWPPHPS